MFLKITTAFPLCRECVGFLCQCLQGLRVEVSVVLPACHKLHWRCLWKREANGPRSCAQTSWKQSGKSNTHSQPRARPAGSVLNVAHSRDDPEQVPTVRTFPLFCGYNDSVSSRHVFVCWTKYYFMVSESLSPCPQSMSLDLDKTLFDATHIFTSCFPKIRSDIIHQPSSSLSMLLFWVVTLYKS
jgi:hypothetical protein